MLTLPIASWRLVSLHVHFPVNLKSLELASRGSGMQAQKVESVMTLLTVGLG